MISDAIDSRLSQMLLPYWMKILAMTLIKMQRKVLNFIYFCIIELHSMVVHWPKHIVNFLDSQNLFSYVGNDCQALQKYRMCLKNRNSPYFPNLSIPNHPRWPWFRKLVKSRMIRKQQNSRLLDFPSLAHGHFYKSCITLLHTNACLFPEVGIFGSTCTRVLTKFKINLCVRSCTLYVLLTLILCLHCFLGWGTPASSDNGIKWL